MVGNPDTDDATLGPSHLFESWHERKARRAAERKLTIAAAAERTRLAYVRAGLPIPPPLIAAVPAPDVEQHHRQVASKVHKSRRRRKAGKRLRGPRPQARHLRGKRRAAARQRRAVSVNRSAGISRVSRKRNRFKEQNKFALSLRRNDVRNLCRDGAALDATVSALP